MEMKPQQQQQHKHDYKAKANSLVWDCGSSLYDSFERNSFQRELDSAIGRTQSMPHLSDHSRRAPPDPPASRPQSISPKRSSSKISRSINKIFRSIFRPKPNTSSMVYQVHEQTKEGGQYYYVHDRSNWLSTIPEISEQGGEYMGHSSAEFNSMVNKTASEPFISSSSIGISCA
ncbi:Avr9/Cf-9 rapidly elicited protein [Thalictrum thalictroides]|uniref:Avr9/Cf-9 rapidly elicited protein n=1 Tax=Thalictrum thalictroides TaxID=46969 RepID=A0A7J6VVF1_THATH|nr:Avr9/Cf-9 rapidly elicited protein [Thalictrum thalictroides]